MPTCLPLRFIVPAGRGKGRGKGKAKAVNGSAVEEAADSTTPLLAAEARSAACCAPLTRRPNVPCVLVATSMSPLLPLGSWQAARCSLAHCPHQSFNPRQEGEADSASTADSTSVAANGAASSSNNNLVSHEIDVIVESPPPVLALAATPSPAGTSTACRPYSELTIGESCSLPTQDQAFPNRL